MDKKFTPKYRFKKAYRTAAAVLWSYLWASFLKKFLGQKWYERRILALHLRNAERVKTAILDLQGLFIKIGQLLSILSNFLPEAFQKPLESLQDKLPPRPLDEVRQRIFEELGAMPENLFSHFENEPLAAASIGQAHRARLLDGSEVVVKVQHIGIEKVAEVDLKIIQRLVEFHQWWFRIQGLEHVYSQVKKMIEEELDFEREAAAMQKIAENLRSEPRIVVPKVLPQFSTQRVMTTTFQQGVKISNLRQLDDWQLDRQEIADRVLQIYCRMVFKDGFYHADPHPGNLLVQQDGTLVLLDFGAVAVLPKQFREGIPNLIEAALKNDSEAMVEVLRDIGFLADGREAERTAVRIIAALRNFLQNEIQLNGLNFKDIQVNPFNNSLNDLIREIGLSGISSTVQLPKEYVLLNRTVTLLVGLCHSLAPDFNPLDTIRPFAQKYLLESQGGELGFFKDFLKRNLTNLISLPSEFQKTMSRARRGELEMRSPDVLDGARLVYFGIQQAVWAGLAVAAGWFALHFFEAGFLAAARWAGGAGVVFGLVFFFKILAGRRLRRRMV